MASPLQEGISVVTVGRTTPIPPGPQPAAKSLPVVLATDTEAVPVKVENQQITEVSLSLLGIPRSEVALGIFADVTTYAVNPNEWQSRGLLGTAVASGTTVHVPAESAAKVSCSTANSNQLLSSKRFFRYQPGRVSSATFGVRVSVSTDSTDIKKWGAFDSNDGYYFEVQGGSPSQTGEDKNFNFYVVRRTSAFAAYTTYAPQAGDIGTIGQDPVIKRDGLTYVHAGIFDTSLRVAAGGVDIGLGSAYAIKVATANQYTYEYRVPRKYFSSDRMDGVVGTQYYADQTPGASSFGVSIGGSTAAPVASYTNGSTVQDADGNVVADESLWDFDFSKVTMTKIEYSWYGAVGAKFLAYVPDKSNPGEARWVTIHHLRVSNQLTTPSLGNPTLPLSYYVQKGTSLNESAIYKYGASYYIDGGDKGTIVARSISNTTDRALTISGQALLALQVKNTIGTVRNRMQVYPTRLSAGFDGRGVVTLIKNPTVVSGTPSFVSADTLSPLNVFNGTGVTVVSGGTTIATFYAGNGGNEWDLSSYFAYNKDYLSFPLAAVSGDTLYVVARGAAATISGSAAITWEEQV
jgi:hypothetical protein